MLRRRENDLGRGPEIPDSLFRPCADGVLLLVRLTPKSARDAVDGTMIAGDGGRCLQARVRAVPEEGAANRALERLIAAWIGVPKGSVEVAAGGRSRMKTVLVRGAPAELGARIEALAGRDPPKQ
jgi:uncharacterized protein YggU (UPF0235/DUF167 family)